MSLVVEDLRRAREGVVFLVRSGKLDSITGVDVIEHIDCAIKELS